MPFVGSPVVAVDELGIDGTVWTWGTFLRSFSAGRRRQDGHLSRQLTVFFRQKTAPETGDQTTKIDMRIACIAMGLLVMLAYVEVLIS